MLRHAYIEVGDFLIGQTLSTFLDPVSAPQVLDYGGNAASVFARQPQIRFTKRLDDFIVRLSVENPTSNLGTNLITDDQRIPDFVARIDFDKDYMHMSVAGIVRELRIDNGEFEAHALTGGFSKRPGNVSASIMYGLMVGLCIGSYTAWDAYVVSVVMVSPVLLDYASNTFRSIFLAPVALRRKAAVKALWNEHRGGVIIIGLLSPLAYILFLYAITFTPVTLLAPVRETSVLISVLMGSILLGEGHLKRRLIWSVVIVGGVSLLATA